MTATQDPSLRSRLPASTGLGNRLIGFGLVTPAVIIVSILVIALFDLFSRSIFEYLPPSERSRTARITFDNYLRIFTDPVFLDALWTTVRLSVATMLSCILLGLALAWWIVRTPSALVRRLVVILIAVPFFIGHIVKLYALLQVLGNNGIVNHALRFTGVIGPSDFFPLVRNDRAVVIGLITFVLPFVTLTLVGAFRRLDEQIEEAARNLGANSVRVFVEVTLPLLMPGIIGASILAFVLAGMAFATPLILGGGAVKMIANSVYDQAMYVLNVPLAAALAVVALVATLLILFVSAQLERRLMRRTRHV